MNVYELIRAEASRHSWKTALVDEERVISYHDLFGAIEELAGELVRRGVSRHDRVALVSEDSIEYVIASLAILAAEAVVVPISPTLSGDEVDAIVERIRVAWIVCEPNRVDRPGATFLEIRGVSEPRKILLLRIEEGSPSANPDGYVEAFPAFIRFSSGTTGESKGVVLSHRSIIERTDAANKGLCVTDRDTVIWVLSMSFHFVVTILLFLRKGATIVLCGQRFPEGLVHGLTKNQGTLVYASPIHYRMLAASKAVKPEALAGLRMAVSTAVGLSEQDAVLFAERFGLELAQAYGIIEVGLPAINSDGGAAKRGSVGRLLPDYRVDIRNADAAGIGEIWLRGPGMFDAYFSPWQPRLDLHPDGWFKTGDVGRVDSDGYLWISGRHNYVINFAGMKIFPEEVESVLNRHPSVRESLVYAVRHSTFGQLPCAKLVLRDGASLDPAAMRKYCYANLAPHKVPKEFEPVDAIEKTASGKLKRAWS